MHENCPFKENLLTSERKHNHWNLGCKYVNWFALPLRRGRASLHWLLGLGHEKPWESKSSMWWRTVLFFYFWAFTPMTSKTKNRSKKYTLHYWEDHLITKSGPVILVLRFLVMFQPHCSPMVLGEREHKSSRCNIQIRFQTKWNPEAGMLCYRNKSSMIA